MWELFGVIVDVVPRGFRADEFVKAIAHDRIIVEAVSCDRERILFGSHLAKARAAEAAERARIFEGRFGF